MESRLFRESFEPLDFEFCQKHNVVGVSRIIAELENCAKLLIIPRAKSRGLRLKTKNHPFPPVIARSLAVGGATKQSHNKNHPSGVVRLRRRPSAGRGGTRGLWDPRR